MNGRAMVTSDYRPASGQRHLVLDDSVNDALYSVAEATLQLDLSHKKDVVLSFKAKSLGNEPDYPQFGFPRNDPRKFDGVSVSADGADFSPNKPRPDGALQIFLRDADGHFIELFTPPK